MTALCLGINSVPVRHRRPVHEVMCLLYARHYTHELHNRAHSKYYGWHSQPQSLQTYSLQPQWMICICMCLLLSPPPSVPYLFVLTLSHIAQSYVNTVHIFICHIIIICAYIKHMHSQPPAATVTVLTVHSAHTSWPSFTGICHTHTVDWSTYHLISFSSSHSTSPLQETCELWPFHFPSFCPLVLLPTDPSTTAYHLLILHCHQKWEYAVQAVHTTQSN